MRGRTTTFFTLLYLTLLYSSFLRVKKGRKGRQHHPRGERSTTPKEDRTAAPTKAAPLQRRGDGENCTTPTKEEAKQYHPKGRGRQKTTPNHQGEMKPAPTKRSEANGHQPKKEMGEKHYHPKEEEEKGSATHKGRGGKTTPLKEGKGASSVTPKEDGTAAASKQRRS